MSAHIIRHIVLLRFKPEALAPQLAALAVSFHQMRDLIDGIQALEYGENESPEKLNQGFTHALQVSFESAGARDAYLPHPAHQSVVAQLTPLVQDVLVFDYAT